MDQDTSKKVPRQSHFFFIAVLLGLFVLTWSLFEPFVIMMVAGVFIAVLALPIDKYWERVFPNRIAAFFTMFTLLLFIMVPAFGLGLTLAGDASDLATSIANGDFRTNIEENTLVQRGLGVLFPDNTTEERNATLDGWITQFEGQAVDWLLEFGATVISKVPDALLALTVILFVVYYVLTDGHRLVDFVTRAVPLPTGQVKFLIEEAHKGLKGVFVGQILTSIIQGAIGGIGFLVVGLPGFLLWAAVMAVLSLLPVVGAFVVWVPAAIFLAIQYSVGEGALWKPIFLVIWGAVVVSQVDNFIKPKLIGDRASIHPLFVLVGVLGGVAAFGFIGLFLGPLLVAVTVSILKVWQEEYLSHGLGINDPQYQPLPEEPNRKSRKAARAARKEKKAAKPKTFKPKDGEEKS